MKGVVVLGKSALRRTRWRRWPCCEGHDGHPRKRFARTGQRAAERRAWRTEAGLHPAVPARADRSVAS
ncbi:hypothetical protein [Actinoplanes sp. NPDC051859]|uniref:hypothetical protein n=1 Tax=Actinoplanes sp. NPDC051859 TaxID=3363909 RepID=UPI0037B9141B